MLTNEDIAMKTIHLIVGNMNTMFFTPYYHFDLIVSDPDDNKFVDCALIANADYIVSDDSHFNVLCEIPFPPIRLLKLKEFARLLKNKIAKQ